MHRPAHKWFAGGFCSIMCLLFGFTISSLLLITTFAIWLGPLPDADQKISFLEHRGFTHTPFFILLITIPITLLISYLSWLLNNLFEIKLFSTSIISLNEVPIPGNLFYFVRGELILYFTNPVTLIFFALFFSMLTHIALDIITPSGIDFLKWHIRGGILSEDATTNKMFMLVGIFMILVSLSLSIISLYSSVSTTAAFLMLFLVLLIVGVFILSLYLLERKKRATLKCYSVNGEDFCTKKKCVFIKGEKICVTE